MQEIVQATAKQHVSAGKLHDLADRLAVSGVVAMVWASLAGGLGGHGAVETFDHGMHQEAGAGGAERKRFWGKKLDFSQIWRDGGAVFVVFFAINRDED